MPINKATPAIYHENIKDESAVAQLPTPLETPQHFPLFYVHTERGRVRPQAASGTDLQMLYGAESFNERGKFFSHQTQAAMICNGNANQVMIKRVLGTGAKKATLRLSLEVGEDVFKPYQRNADGSVVRDVLGVKQRDAGAPDQTGLIARWLVTEIAPGDFGLGLKTNGAAYGSAGNPSDIYPIHDFEVDSEGAYGSNTGLRLWLPHARTAAPAHIETMEEEETLVNRIQFVERPSATKAPVVLTNIFDSRYTDFAYKAGVLGAGNVNLDTQNPVTAYSAEDEGVPPVYGPFGNYNLYTEFLKEVQDELKVYQDVIAGNTDSVAALFNINNGLDLEGNEYDCFYMDETGLSLNEQTTIYALGGDDGIVGEAELDAAVKIECDTNWENVDYPLVDKNQFAFSVLYDTGFSEDTKQSLLSTLGYRNDISVAVCTQDLALPENDLATERAMGGALRTAARLVPESIIHGTSTCRAVIVGQMATLKASLYKRRLPMIMELIHKRSRFMNASSGIMNAVYAYDKTPRNRLEIMVSPTHTWKSSGSRDADWDNGVNYVQYAKSNEIFFPAYQSVYDDDTSIINSEVTMLIAVDVIKIQNYLWTEFTGSSDLTNDQLIEQVNARFDELVADRYNNRVSLESLTYFDAGDIARGYSWRHSAIMRGNVMKTVGTFNLIARRA